MKLKVNSPGVVLGGQVCRQGQVIDLDEKYLGQLIRLKKSLDLDVELLESPKAKFSLNYRQDTPDPRDFVMSSPSALALSTVVDYGPQMSPVKDQGMLGSCVGFAVAAVKEWQEKKEHLQEKLEGKKYDRLVEHDYSEQWIYYKAKEIDDWPGEEGTSLRYAMKILQKQGVPPEKGWKYDDSNVGEPESWAPLVARWGYGGSYHRIYTPADLELALANEGPVAIGIVCFEEIFNPGPSGVVRMPRNNWLHYGGHAVACVGYNRQTQMFKFKNSWGKSWGQSGYGYLPYAYIAKYMMDAWVLKDINVNREMFINGPTNVSASLSAVEGNVQKEEVPSDKNGQVKTNCTIETTGEEIVIGENCCNQPDECIVADCDCECHGIEEIQEGCDTDGCTDCWASCGGIDEKIKQEQAKPGFFKKLFKRK